MSRVAKTFAPPLTSSVLPSDVNRFFAIAPVFPTAAARTSGSDKSTDGNATKTSLTTGVESTQTARTPLIHSDLPTPRVSQTSISDRMYRQPNTSVKPSTRALRLRAYHSRNFYAYHAKFALWYGSSDHAPQRHLYMHPQKGPPINDQNCCGIEAPSIWCRSEFAKAAR